MKVTSRNINALPHGKHLLENGIYLRKTSVGSYWLFRYQFNGRRREVGLGGINQPVSAVRAKAAKMRALMADGIDPIEAIREFEAENVVIEAPFFKELADDAIEYLAFLRQWKSESPRRDYQRKLDQIIIPALGKKRGDEITVQDVVKVLRPHWVSEPSAVRVLAAIRGVLTYALSKGFVDRNVAEWRGNLDSFLPPTSSLSRGKTQPHHSAVSVEELANIAEFLTRKNAISAKCLRSDAKDKRTEPFVVPLSRQAVELLKSLPQVGEHIFTVDRNSGPLRPTCLFHYMKEQRRNR